MLLIPPNTEPLVWMVGQVSDMIFPISGCRNGFIFHQQSQSDAKATSFSSAQATFLTCKIIFHWDGIRKFPERWQNVKALDRQYFE